MTPEQKRIELSDEIKSLVVNATVRLPQQRGQGVLVGSDQGLEVWGHHLIFTDAHPQWPLA